MERQEQFILISNKTQKSVTCNHLENTSVTQLESNMWRPAWLWHPGEKEDSSLRELRDCESVHQQVFPKLSSQPLLLGDYFFRASQRRVSESGADKRTSPRMSLSFE